MEIFEGNQSLTKTFFTHVFSTTDESKSEFLNAIQYSTLAIIPVVALNKLVQRIVPEADLDKSSMEITFEIILQLILMFCGIILIHRIVTYVPTYSGFKYEPFVLTNAVLTFLVIILSVQTKMGIKVNILTDRLSDLWNGTSASTKKRATGGRGYGAGSILMGTHSPSQADHLDGPVQSDMFPPAPTVAPKSKASYDMMMRGNPGADMFEPAAANSVLAFK